MAGTSPFRGGFAGSAAKRLPPQREQSAVRQTEGKLFCWGICCRCGRAYLPPFAPRMVPLLLRKEAKRWTEAVCQLSDRPRHPFGSLTFELVSYPTLAGRGGSVSRRDHKQLAGNRAHSQAETSQKKSIPSNASRSSGERGLGGEALLSEKRPLPPESPVILSRLFGREREGGSFSTEKLPPSQSPSPLLAQIVLCFADLGDSGVAEGRELKGLGLRRKG